MVVFISACIIWFDLHNSGGGGGNSNWRGEIPVPPPPPPPSVCNPDGNISIIIAEHTWSYTHHLVDVYIIFVKHYPIYVFG